MTGHVSSAVVTAPPDVPAPVAGAALAVGGQTVDLAARVLVAGVVPAPRFGRENEVVATAASVAAAGADFVDVSLHPRLLGPVAQAGAAPVAARADSAADARAAARAGATVLALVPDLVADAALVDELRDAGAGVVVVVDDLAELPAARAVAERAAAPLAFDATRLAGAAAIAREATAVADGCRLLRTTDVRRSRRVAAVTAALLAARRTPAGHPSPTQNDQESDS